MKVVKGDTPETNRIRIQFEALVPGDRRLFAEVYHLWGDGSVTRILFSPAEARFVMEQFQAHYKEND